MHNAGRRTELRGIEVLHLGHHIAHGLVGGKSAFVDLQWGVSTVRRGGKEICTRSVIY